MEGSTSSAHVGRIKDRCMRITHEMVGRAPTSANRLQPESTNKYKWHLMMVVTQTPLRHTLFTSDIMKFGRNYWSWQNLDSLSASKPTLLREDQMVAGESARELNYRK